MAAPHAARLPPRAWAVAVLVVVGVAAVGTERVPNGRPGLPLSLGRVGARLYRSTTHYLMDKLAPAAPPTHRADRWGRPRLKKPLRRPAPLRSAALQHDECLGAVYRRSGGGGSQCVSALTAALVVGVALLVQAMFYVAVGAACPGVLGSSSSSLLGEGRNLTSVVNIAVTNGVALETLQEAMMQEQTQEQEQTQDQDLTQTITQDIDNNPVATINQDLTQTHTLVQEDQTFERRALALTLALARALTDLWPAHPLPGAWGRAWSLNLCPALHLYLNR